MHRRRLGRTGIEVSEVGYGAWGIDWVGRGSWPEAIEQLKAEGKIRAFGVSINEHDMGVLARVPLDEGALAGRIGPDSEFPEGDFRNEYFRDGRREEVDERVRAIVAVIPGMRTVRNVERNFALGDGRGLGAEHVRALKRHRWVRNFYA